MRFLAKNDTVAFVAPAGGCQKGDLDEAEAYFARLGHAVVTGDCVYKNTRFMSGSDIERAGEINRFFGDDAVGALFAVRGGYGSLRLLDKIDYETVAKHPKFFVGLSDTTALQNALLAKAGLVSLTGCVLCRKTGFPLKSGATERSLFKALRGERQTFDSLTVLKGGKAKGRLVGGCLSMFATLAGTPYLPDLTNAVLLFEDVNEQPYVVDRLLTRCALAGVFDKAAGVVFGGFSNCVSKDPADGTITDVLNEWKDKLSVPCVCGLPYGHGENSCVLPLGGKVFLNAGDGALTVDGE